MKFKTLNKVLGPLNSKEIENIIKANNYDVYAKKLTTQNLIKLFVTATLKEFEMIQLKEDIYALNIVGASVITKALAGMEWAKYKQSNSWCKTSFRSSLSWWPCTLSK